MGLELFGDLSNKMSNIVGVYIPNGIDGEAVRSQMLMDFDIEIGTLSGHFMERYGELELWVITQVSRITLSALEVTLQNQGFKLPKTQGPLEALNYYKQLGTS